MIELTRVDGDEALLIPCPTDGCTLLCRVTRGPSYRKDPTTYVWHMEGELPSVSLTPSIHALVDGKTHWHGYLTNGVLRGC